MKNNPSIQGAFFDLDKTIIAKSSMLAYSKTLRQHGLLNRRALVHAAYGQIIFRLLGADEKKMEKIRETALEITKGWNHEKVKKIVNETMHEVVVPIIFEDAVELIEKHKSENRIVVIISSAPSEVVDPIAKHLGADEFIATTSKLDKDGNYTGELEFYSYGIYKSHAIKKLAKEKNIDLKNSYAYSDSITDVPMLESVGNPYAVNPDRELARIAKENNWNVIRFTKEVTLWDRLPVKFFQDNKVRTATAFGIAAISALIFLATKKSNRN